jgi:antagonist of KipI
MDAVAHRLANVIVGNARDAATLEATLLGPELRMEQDTWIAVSGADLHATVDGSAVPIHAAVRCQAGSVLRFGDRHSGARAYVAFDGGIAVPPVLGSRATHVLSGMGGIDGRAVRAGDRIPLGTPPPPSAGAHLAPHRASPGSPPRTLARWGGGVRGGDLATVRPYIGTGLGASTGPVPTGPVAVVRADLQVRPRESDGARLRVLPGPQADAFDASAFDMLQRTRYTIAPQSDRMGYRLIGGTTPPRTIGGDMISDATFAGGLQVPPSGDPILLMADRQATGGYPQLAVVISADLPRAAQLAPGAWVEFEVCTRSEAISALIAQEGKLLAVR